MATVITVHESGKFTVKVDGKECDEHAEPATFRDLYRLFRALSARHDRTDRELRLIGRKVDGILQLLRKPNPTPRIPTTLVLHVGTPTQEI